jgi:uncharacterized protein YdhG (YjbR/CyaY superfamily)
MGRPTNIEEYLERLRDDQQVALQRVRDIIRKAAPQAEECISYGIAAFRQSGMLVGLGASAKHCALYVFSGTSLDAFSKDLETFETSKGTIRFTPDRPLPAALIKRIVQARLKENTIAGVALKTTAGKTKSKKIPRETSSTGRKAR